MSNILSNILKSENRLIDLFCHPSSVSGSALANGKMHLHSSIKRKLAEEKGYVFDKRLRYNVRQNESNCRFRDIVVRKEEGFTHVLLSSQTTDNNALTPEVRRGMYTHLHMLFYCLYIQVTIFVCLALAIAATRGIMFSGCRSICPSHSCERDIRGTR